MHASSVVVAGPHDAPSTVDDGGTSIARTVYIIHDDDDDEHEHDDAVGSVRDARFSRESVEKS
jgi:hypothetical protein